jgi:hypothetical protein
VLAFPAVVYGAFVIYGGAEASLKAKPPSPKD